MRLHVMVSILLCGLINFLYGSEKTQPQIRSNSAIIALCMKKTEGRYPVVISTRFTPNQFVSNLKNNVVTPEQIAENSDLDSNGTGSAATSPAASPQPQPVLDPHNSFVLAEMLRTVSFPEFDDRGISPSTSGGSLDELGSSWNKSGSPLKKILSGSGFVDGHPIPTPKGPQDCPIKTPKKDDDCTENHRLSTPNAPADRHPVPTPEKK